MINRINTRALLICLLLLSCHKVTPEQFDSDKQLFEQANKRFESGDLADATLFYENLKNRFPSSPYAADSELRIADAQFEKGTYDESAISYENFRVLHPSHPKVPYSLFRSGLSYYRDAPKAIDRDQTNLEKAIRTLAEVSEKWPASEEAKLAAPLQSKAKKSLLRRELYIAHFYERNKKYEAAIARYNNVRSQTEFPDLSDESTYGVANMQIKLKQYDEAQKSLAPILENSGSTYFKKAKELDARLQTKLKDSEKKPG